MANLFVRFVNARHSYWRIDDPTRLGALFCILQADLGAFPHAAAGLLQDNGFIPWRLDAWADAIDCAYLAGW